MRDHDSYSDSEDQIVVFTRTVTLSKRLQREQLNLGGPHRAASDHAFRLKNSHFFLHLNSTDLALRALCSPLGGLGLCHL
jgi:hypothetical protein